MSTLFPEPIRNRFGRTIYCALALGLALVTPAHAQLVFDTPSVAFGQVELGNSSPNISVNLRNTGAQPIEVSCSGGATNPAQFNAAQACQGNILAPGETCPWDFSFTPTAPGALTGNSETICNSVPLSVSLSGNGVLPTLALATPSVDFGPVLVDTTTPAVELDLVNKGRAPVTLSCTGGASSAAQFSSNQGCQGVTLNPGDSCPFSYTFTPDAVSSFTADSNWSCNGVDLGIQLLGEGQLPALVMDTPAVDFGTVEVGTPSPTVSVPLRNQGPDPVTISCSGGTVSPAQFNGSQACQGVTLSPGDSCPWNFSFTPDVPGEVTGASNFACNNVALSVTLRGTAAPGGATTTGDPIAVPIMNQFGLTVLSLLLLLGTVLTKGKQLGMSKY